MNIIDAILTKADPVEFIEQYSNIELKRWGNTGEYRGKCPIHGGDNATSFMVKNNSFYCHSCGHGGTIINFVQYLENISYDEAVFKCAEKLNLDINLDEEYIKQKTTIQNYTNITQRHADQVKEITPYLMKRGLTEETIERFDLGWSKGDGTLVIPIRDYHGRVVAFSKRYFDSEPKYRNSKNNDLYDKGSLLYNAHRARKMLKDKPYLFVVEGYMDCMSADQQELPCVAYCGSELTKDHVLLIKDMVQNNPNITVILCPDNDEVGRSKIPKMRQKFADNAPRVNVRVGMIPNKVYNEDKIEWNDGWVDGIKDFNDLLVNNYNIADIPTENIDIYTLDLLLDQCPNPNAEYLVAEEFIKSVKNDMVKADIAIKLTPRWGKELSEVKQYLKVSSNTIEDKLNDFKMADRCIKEYHDMIQHEGLGFGFPTLDASLRGARPGDVVFFGGYSGVGKTFFCVEFTIFWAVRKKKNVLFISLEMPAAALYERIIANIMGISTQEVEKLAKSNDPYSMYSLVKEKVEKYIVVIDKNNLTVNDIDEYVKIANARIWENGKTDVVIIDYLQYMKHEGETEFAGLSKTARGLKPLAKDNNIIVVCLSQLSRQGSAWERPTMKLLKGSGDIESTGDIILLAWRPSEDPNLTAIEKNTLEGTIMLAIGKARRGVLGATDFELFFHKDKTRIREKAAIAA